MRKLGMKVYESDPTTVTEIGTETRNIGKVLGRTQAANALANKIATDVATATRGIARHPRVLVILGVGAPVRVARELLGRRRRPAAPAAAAHRGADGPERGRADLGQDRRQAQPGHDHRRAARQRGDIGRLAAYYRAQPGVAHTNAGNKRRLPRHRDRLLQPYRGRGRRSAVLVRNFMRN